ALNVPANCVANIAVINGALFVLMQSTLAGDAACKKKGIVEKRVSKIARFEKNRNRAKMEATHFFTRQGYDVAAAILLGDSTIHCYPGTDKQRVCAMDIVGLFAVLSLAPAPMPGQSAVAG
ncbi:unnamed protein product, partial [Symbiodinium sp. KB8]